MAVNVIAYSLWGDMRRYQHVFQKNYSAWKGSSPNREVWIYHDDSVNRAFRQKYSKIRWIEMPPSNLHSGSYWRYTAIDEADNVWVRDSDNLFHAERNSYIDQEWEKTGKRLAVFRDHEFMYGLRRSRLYIRGGCFNIKGCTHGLMLNMLNQYRKNYWIYPYGMDECFLGHYVYPYFNGDCVIFARSHVWQNFQHNLALRNHLHDNAVYRVITHSQDDWLGSNAIVTYPKPNKLQQVATWIQLYEAKYNRLWHSLSRGTDRIPPVSRFYRLAPEVHAPIVLAYTMHQFILAIIARYYIFRSSYRKLRASVANATKKENLCLPLVVIMHADVKNLASIHLSIFSVLKQQLEPSKVIVYLPPSANLTDKLKRLQKWGVIIKRSRAPRSLMRHALIDTIRTNPECLYVHADSKIVYPHDWLHNLYTAWCDRPKCVCATRASVLAQRHSKLKKLYQYDLSAHDYEHETRLVDFVPVLAYGVLFPPEVAHCDLLQDAKFANLDSDDDMWLLALIRQAGLLMHVVPKTLYSLNALSGGLTNQNNNGAEKSHHKDMKNLWDYIKPTYAPEASLFSVHPSNTD